MDHEYQALLQTLKAAMKTRGRTYASLADELGISEITLKRTMNGQPAPLSRLFEICRAIGVSFFDVTASAQRSAEEEYILTPEQDAFFAANPAYYSLFIDLYRRESPDAVRDAWNLNEREFFRVLRRFETLGLLELLPKSQFRFRMKGPIRAPQRGKLSRALLLKQTFPFLERAHETLGEPNVLLQTSEVLMTTESIRSLHADLAELGKKYRAISLQDETLSQRKKLKSVRWLMALAPHRSNWNEFKLDLSVLKK